MVLLVLEVHACIAKDLLHFRQLVVFLVHNFRVDNSLLEKWVSLSFSPTVAVMWVTFLDLTLLLFSFSPRRGALIIRRLCVLLDAERVYRELSTILEGESDLDFASIMVQVACYLLDRKKQYASVTYFTICFGHMFFLYEVFSSYRLLVNYLLWQRLWTWPIFIILFTLLCSSSFLLDLLIYSCVPFFCSGFELDFTYILRVVWPTRSFETITCESIREGLICFFICFMVSLTHGNYKPLLVISGNVVMLSRPRLLLSFKNLCFCTHVISFLDVFCWFLLTDISACKYCDSVSGGGRY